jgi:hypothetical protein
MEIETLDADFFRARAHFCQKLAETARAAGPPFTRLFFLAEAYEKRARAAEMAGGQAIKSLRWHSPPGSSAAAN